MSDKEIKIISRRTPQEFESAVNEILNDGHWRIAETEMSVTDHHYFAMMIRDSDD